MVRIKTTAYSDLKAAEQISYASNVVSKMTGNPTYPDPDPELSVVSAQIADLTLKNNLAMGGDHTAILNRNTSSEILVSLLDALSNYVIFIVADAPNAEDLISGAGFEMAAERQPPYGSLPAPQNVRTKGLSRAIFLRWKTVPGAKSYQVLKTTGDATDPNAVWVQECITPRASVTLQNQTPGQAAAFKVYAINSAGFGQPSDVALGMALM